MRYFGTARPSAPAFPELTEREREILELMAQHQSNAMIARRLVLSDKTVRNYLYGILTKLGVPDRSQLIVLAREAGLGVRGGSPGT